MLSKGILEKGKKYFCFQKQFTLFSWANTFK